MPAASIIWTDEKVEELKRLWDAGGSCSEIGAELKITRSAVIGKVHRLGLAGRRVKLSEEVRARRADKIRSRHEARQARGMIIRKARERKVQEPSHPVALPFIGSLNIPFNDLRPFNGYGPNQCRFIAAEPPGPDYLVCGNETLKGESYCGHCKGIVLKRETVATLVPEKVAA